MRSCGIAMLLALSVLSGLVARAWSQERPGGGASQLYVDQCSMCHGVMAPPSKSELEPATPRALASAPVLAGGGSALAVRMPLVGMRLPLGDWSRVAIAPPYGPTLAGLIGRPAGTVAGYNYSRSFQEILRGVVWKRQTLDRWLTDSQLWVPSSIMFYKQPDPAVRAQIIDYLEVNR
jgi:cytochrome c